MLAIQSLLLSKYSLEPGHLGAPWPHTTSRWSPSNPFRRKGRFEKKSPPFLSPDQNPIAGTSLLEDLQCDHEVSYRYKYKFIRATTSNFPSGIMKENRGSKGSIGNGGMLRIQHLVSVASPCRTVGVFNTSVMLMEGLNS
uniref:Uncharacterized protein n=1 Tax=Leersia perrieri TaxID=77586 RepID=A0A0D9VVV2_9ORYZ